MLLQVNNIDVFYDSLKILHDVTIYVKENKITTILGPNGSGKSTLCKTIIGLLKPRHGEIIFNGERIDGLTTPKVIKKGLAIVPEGRRIFGHMSVQDNLQLGAYILPKRKNLQDTLEWVYSLFPILSERRNQLAGTLSGGEQQMLAIARALITRPKLLILDEPSLGLAPKVVLTVYDCINNIVREKTSVLLVEQYADYALRCSDEALVMENGRIVIQGSAEELRKDERVRKAYLGEE